jgi:hypothetical protein
MSLKSRFSALLLIFAGTAASISVAPIAAAESGVLPQPGSENARDTLSDLTQQGYDVQINWVNGYPRVSLDQCWVNNINTADAKGTLRTVYVDIGCPK